MSDSPRPTSGNVVVDQNFLRQFEQQGTVYAKPKSSEQQKVTQAASHPHSLFELTGSDSSDALVHRVSSESPSETEETSSDDEADETDRLVENKDVTNADQPNDAHAAGPLVTADEDVSEPKASCCERVTRFFCGCFFGKPKQS